MNGEITRYTFGVSETLLSPSGDIFRWNYISPLGKRLQSRIIYWRRQWVKCGSPVTGASISIIVFSFLSSIAPSLMILRAADSSMRPSRMKCCFRTSGRGLFVRASNTSLIVNLLEGGNGTPEKRNKFYYLYKETNHWGNKKIMKVGFPNEIIISRKLESR